MPKQSAIASLRRFLCACLLAGLSITPSRVLVAQTVTATVNGVTSDPSGAVVPGARITATNVLTGLRVEAVSSEHGHYVLPLLPAGRYTMTIQKFEVANAP